MSAISDVNSNIILQDKSEENNQSVFRAALPYAAGTLSLAGLGTYVTVTTFVAGASPLIIGAVATAALAGAYAFCMTAITGACARDSADFKERIGPALIAGVTIAVTLVFQIVIETVLRTLIERALGIRR